MKKIGFLLSHMGTNQLAQTLIEDANAFIEKQSGVDIIAFVQNMVAQKTTPMFAVMNIQEAWEFNGTVVATDLATAAKMLVLPGTKEKLFYVWDLEWMRHPELGFGRCHHIYANPNIGLIARSMSHAKVINRVWGRQCETVPDIETLLSHVT